MVWVTRKRRILRRKPSGSSKLETKVTKNSKRNWNVVRRRNLVARETRVGQSRAIRDTNKFTFQLRFIIDVVKSGPTYRVKSREIPLSAHWPCAIIDRATAGGVGRFHNRKGAINVPCNDLNSWIIPAEDRRGFFLSPFPPIFLPYFPRPLPSTEFGSLSFPPFLPLSRFNQRKSLTRMPPFAISERRSPDEISRRSREFQFCSWTMIRSGRTIDMSVRKEKENRGRYDKSYHRFMMYGDFFWKWDYHNSL